MASSGDESDFSDSEVQQELLKQLNRYGESLLEKKNDQEKVRKKRPKITDSTSGIARDDEVELKKRKKKKKKKVETFDDPFDSEEFIGDEEVKGEKVVSAEQRHLEELRSKLGLTETEILRLKQQTSKEPERPVTKPKLGSVKPAGRKRPPPEVIVFEDPARRKKKSGTVGHIATRVEADKEDEYDSPEFDLHKARHEVLQFGIKGFDKVAKEEAQTALMVKLGAKPPKRPYINYKELQVMRKESKETDSNRASYDKLMGYVASKKGTSKERKSKKDLKDLDGQVGSYRDGVQVLRRDDITKIKQSGSKKKGRR